MNRPLDLLVSGYASMDRMLKIQTPAAVGYTSLISNPDNTRIYYGGCSVNIAYALCRLGLRAMPILRVGRDYEEIGFKAFLEEGGVPTQAVTRLSQDITSVCYLVQDAQGQHITLFYPGAMDGQYAQPLPDSFFRQAGMGMITVGSRRDNELFFAKCKEHGLPLAFGMKGDMDAFPPDFLREVLWYCQLVFCNRAERQAMEALLGIPLAELLTRGNARALITTLGEEGSRYQSREEEGTLPIYRDVMVRDTTGSGDAYISGFLYGYLTGRPLRECAMLGTVEASFALEQAGCCTGLPEREGLLARYQRYQAQQNGGS